MIILWFLTGVSLVAAFLAWNRARRADRRLEQLSQSYWELRYQHGELRAQVQRMTGEISAPSDTPAPPARQPAEAFVPLSALRR